MPKVTISTYSEIEINNIGDKVAVSKIVSEEPFVDNLSKEVSFGKYSTKKSLYMKDRSQDNDLCR